MELTSENVFKIFKDCLFKEEPADGTKYVPGSAVTKLVVAFVPEKIEEHSAEIKELLDELPGEFNESIGGGWSFLQACMTKDGKQWGEHANIEQLFALGLASGWAKYLIEDREKWGIFYGSMPYFVVLNNRIPVSCKTK